MKKTPSLLAHLLSPRACLWAALGLLAVGAFRPPPVRAAVVEAWAQRYDDGGGFDQAEAVALDVSGNVVVTGFSATIKYLANGMGFWTNSAGGYALAVDRGGNVVVTGSSNNTNANSGYNSDYYTAKYAAADGALLWEQRYNGPGNAHDYPSAVAVDGSGNVVVTGWSYNANFNADYYTAKYAAADGALLWVQRYADPANGDDYPSAVAVDGSGNVVVTGVSDLKYNGCDPVEGDFYTAKYAAADGALLWERRYNGPTNSIANSVAVDSRGDVVVTGSSNNTNANSGYNSDYYTAKYAAADGALLWEQRYNGPGNAHDYPSAVAVDGSGNVVVTGNSYNDVGGPDYYTAKYASADGALLWENRYNGPGNNSDYSEAVAVDGSGNVVVTGGSFGSGGYFDYYTAKYAAADGALLWEKRYNGGTASNLALGPNGVVAVAGSSSGDYATVVYRDDVYPISIALVPTSIRLRFIGIPGRSYSIERAATVTGPWTTINTQIAPASGFLEHIDTTPPVGSAFYRTAQP